MEDDQSAHKHVAWTVSVKQAPVTTRSGTSSVENVHFITAFFLNNLHEQSLSEQKV